MRVPPEEVKASNKYRVHTAYIECTVDKSGKAEIDSIVNYDEVPIDRVTQFFQTREFDASSIPADLDKWRYSAFVSFMNRSRSRGKIERKQEIEAEQKLYRERIIADTINGVYIPKNIEECFIQLNKILKQKDVDAIKSLKDRDEMVRYHLGLGMWLRNNWGLWGGSRLQQYLLAKGYKHPDDMTGDLLPLYYDWLHGVHEI